MTRHVESDRICGVLVGAACGDALGAGYEFGPSLAPGTPVVMRGQGAFAPGEWTDDSAQMVAVTMAAADGLSSPVPFGLDSLAGQEAVAEHLLDWYYSPARLKDIGIHTAAVMQEVATVRGPGLAERFASAARSRFAARPSGSGGNGALMRTAPVALAHFDDPARMVSAAMAVGALTHADPMSGQACAVWCLAIRAALIRSTAPLEMASFTADVKFEIEHWMRPDHAAFWIDILDEAEGTDPRSYTPKNGYSLVTLQAAWAAITSTPVPSTLVPSSSEFGFDAGRHLALALAEAVRGGGDADTVACVAGGLLGAMWGLSALPLQWRRSIFGWPGSRDRELVGLAINACPATHRTGGWPHSAHQDYSGWSGTEALAVHPFDDRVLIGGVDAACGRVPLPRRPDAVVSLCRMGSADLDWLELDPSDRVEVRLIDEVGANPNLDLVLADAAAAVADFRASGKSVLLHCVAAQSRTPAVAAMYAINHLGVPASVALDAVIDVLPSAHPNSDFRAAITRSQP